MRLAFRLAVRELRSGLSGFRILIACLMLSVAAIAAVGSVRMAIQEGLSREASALLGGDAEARFTYRFASDEERAWLSANALAVSEIVDFRSMATVVGSGGPERALTQVKGVDASYPLYGTVSLSPALPLAQALGVENGLPGFVAEKVLVDRLALKLGDTISLGTKTYEFRATLLNEPDGVTSGFGLGPRIIVARDALEGAGLLTPGTLFNTAYRLQIDPNANLASLRSEALRLFRDTGLRWRDNRNGTPGVSRFVDRLSAFLVIVGLAGLAVGGVGVSAAVRAFLATKTETIATLKTLGAEGRLIFAVYLIQIGTLAALGIVLGLALGAGIPALLAPIIEARLPVPAVFGIYPTPLAEAALYGALTALLFTIWPLARARDIRPSGLFRDAIGGRVQWPRHTYIAATGLVLALFVGLAAWLSGIPVLALWSALGITVALLLLSLSARGAARLARHLGRSRFARGRPSLRLAFGAVGGPGGETTSVILSLGLGLTVLAAIGQIDSNLRSVINRDLPGVAPAFFFVDIQPDQLAPFQNLAKSDGKATRIETAPMLRGIITRINGTPARAYVREATGASHWALQGDRGVTYSTAPPQGAEITQGSWWPEDYSGPPLLSFAEEEGQEMGLKLGDELTLNVLGRDITAKIANFRVVEFQNMGINFLIVLDHNALAGAPHTHIATVYSEESGEAPLLRSLADNFPNITAIRVRDAIDRFSEALEGLGAATRYGALITLLTGFVVLIGAAAAGERRRIFEAAILKSIGATRARILLSFALRSALLGMAAGFVAIFAGAVAGWGVMTFVMESTYHFEPVSAFTIVLGGAFVSLIAGLAFAWRPLSQRPARVLRSRD